MPGKLIIHAGTWKTGTTALQSFFHKNRKLLERHGVIYPDLDKQNRREHHTLAWSLGSDQAREKWSGNVSIWEDLAALLNQTDKTVVISSEMIFSSVLRPKVAKMVQSMLGKNAQIEIALYLRRQDGFLESGYAWQVKQGVPLPSVDEYIASRDPNYQQQLTNLGKIWGKENLRVRAYENNRFVGGSIFKDFFDLCGLTWPEAAQLPRRNINPSLPAWLVHPCRHLNALDHPLQQRCEINNLLRDIALQEVTHANKDKTLGVFSEKQRYGLVKKYEETNRQAAIEFLGKADGRFFHQELPAPDNDARQSENPEFDVLQIIDEYIANKPKDAGHDLTQQILRVKHILSNGDGVG